MHRDLPEGESLCEAQLDRGAAFRTQLLEHDSEPRDPLSRIEVPVELRQLRPKCRAAVELRFAQGLTYREVAMHLGVSPQMAKKYVAQGLSHCRRRMAALG